MIDIGDFTSLKSDKDLIDQLKHLSIESESDQKTLDYILKRDKLTNAQRVWMNALLFRKGSQFST
jgi:hypothetical protein